MPFIAKTMLVSGPISGIIAGAASVSTEDFSATKTTSWIPSVSGRSVTRIRAQWRSAPIHRVIPRSAMAASWAPRATAATSIPAAAAPAPSRAATWPPTAPAPKTTIFIALIPYRPALMQSVLSSRLGQAGLAAALLVALWSMPAAAVDLFARHTVTVQFATSEGKSIADAEVRVFAPGEPGRPALTGRTDSTGKFEFSANTDGLWSAEARGGGEIARVTVRVGSTEESEPLSPVWVVGGLLLLLILAVGYRVVRRRNRGPPNRPGSPPRGP